MAQLIKELKTNDQWKAVAEYHGFQPDANATVDEHVIFISKRIDELFFTGALNAFIEKDPEVVALKAALETKIQQKKEAAEVVK